MCIRDSAKSGCGQSPTPLMTPQTNMQTALVATDGTTVFFTSNLGVFACSVSGCSGAPQGVGSGYQNTGLSATGGYAYWGDDLASAVYRCTAPCTGSPTVIEADASYPWGTAVDSTNVWWTARGIVASCPQSGCSGSPSPIASSPFPGSITVDGTNAYWWNQGYPDAASPVSYT